MCQDERSGFGLPCANDHLNGVNEKRTTKGIQKPAASPGLRFLAVGKNKDGQCGYDHFKEHAENVLDVLKHIEPYCKYLLRATTPRGLRSTERTGRAYRA